MLKLQTMKTYDTFFVSGVMTNEAGPIDLTNLCLKASMSGTEFSRIKEPAEIKLTVTIVDAQQGLFSLSLPDRDALYNSRYEIDITCFDQVKVVTTATFIQLVDKAITSPDDNWS